MARERLGVEFIAKPLVVIGLIGAALAVDTGDGVVRGLVVAALGASLVYSVQQSLRSLRRISAAFVPAAVVSALSTFGMANTWASFGSLPNDTWIRIYGRTDAGELYSWGVSGSGRLGLGEDVFVDGQTYAAFAAAQPAADRQPDARSFIPHAEFASFK